MIELVKYNWARDIADHHLGTNIKSLEKLGAKSGYPLDPNIKVAIIKNLKAQHPPIDINAIACLIAANFVVNWATDSDDVLEDLKHRILNYGETMGVAWRYLEYCMNILDKQCTLEDIMAGRV